MSKRKPRMAFISPVFLFPNDTGGRIRTTNVLRGLHGGSFDVTLLMPASLDQRREWEEQLKGICNRLVAWEPRAVRPQWRRALDLFSALPVNVAADRTSTAVSAVRDALACEAFDVIVFDFVHCAVLKPSKVGPATVCFTHNVEAEIFSRHAARETGILMRRIWRSQAAKMQRFEMDLLRQFTVVVAVSDRDAQHFSRQYGVVDPVVIPTGVDLDFFQWQEPRAIDAGPAPTVVFTGSMDWAANVDAIRFFLTSVWPRVLAAIPQARFVVVGRNPPASLIDQSREISGVTFTGFVEDVRPHVHNAHVFAIPLRIGGGTRIKAFEAMAMGCPVVSTSIGVEGLDVTPGEHYVAAELPDEQASAIVELLRDDQRRRDLSRRARDRVERYGHRVAATAFQDACLRALRTHASCKASAEALFQQA